MRSSNRYNCETESGLTWPGPSFATMISGNLGAIGFSENSGSESWLQLKEVYVFCFESALEDDFSVDSKNSLPFGSHFNSADLTA